MRSLLCQATQAPEPTEGGSAPPLGLPTGSDNEVLHVAPGEEPEVRRVEDSPLFVPESRPDGDSRKCRKESNVRHRDRENRRFDR